MQRVYFLKFNEIATAKGQGKFTATRFVDEGEEREQDLESVQRWFPGEHLSNAFSVAH